jgi:HK97 family phage major capsid protein
MTTLQKLQARMKEILDKRSKISAQQAAIVEKIATEKRDANEDEAKEVKDLAHEKREIDKEVEITQARIEEFQEEHRADERAAALRATINPAPEGGATVGREPRTYTPETARKEGISFFNDAYRSQVRMDLGARERVERHMRESIVENERSGTQTRATTTSSYAGLVVPQYLVDLYAPLLRAGRPIANVCRKIPLPNEGMSVNYTRMTTGATAASQATQNTQVSSTDQVWADATTPVVTIAGEQKVSRQSLERGTPGMDTIIYQDLIGAYAAELDRQVVNGSGASNQLLGILQTSGTSVATAYAGVLTIGNFSSKVAGQIAAIAGLGRGVTPRVVAMHPRRWGWMQSLVDSQGRPLAVAQAVNPVNAQAVILAAGGYSGDSDTPTFVGQMANGLPVLTDANIPINVGTNVEDMTMVFDNSQALLWEENDGMPTELRFDQQSGDTLSVILAIYGYVAFTAARYPLAFGKIGGLDTVATYGQIVPAF